MSSGSITQRVQASNNYVLRFWVIVIVAQVLDKYKILRYLDPWGYVFMARVFLVDSI